MKQILITFGLVVLFAGANAQVLATANSPEYKNVLKMSASLFSRNTFQIGVERFFEPNTSYYITAGLNLKDSDIEKNWGVRTELQMRFHVYTVIKPKISHRLYFAPYLFNHYLETEKYEYGTNGNRLWKKDSFDALGGGMLFGWSYSFANRINMDIYTGGGLRKTFDYDALYNYTDGIYDYGYSGIVPRLGIDIGFWF